jgi:hypothetical protein
MPSSHEVEIAEPSEKTEDTMSLFEGMVLMSSLSIKINALYAGSEHREGGKMQGAQGSWL